MKPGGKWTESYSRFSKIDSDSEDDENVSKKKTGVKKVLII
jgi:hypothetical protein